MKLKKLALVLLASSLLAGCGKKTINKVISPDMNVRYAYYMQCLSNGYVIDLPEENPEAGKLIEKFVFEDGNTHCFYPAEGYEFI